jgi:hypothetical protein
MKKTAAMLLLSVSMIVAQGPRPGSRGGPGGPGGGPGGFGGRGMGMPGSGRVVTGAPYSAVEVLTIQEKFADGNSVNTNTSTPRARDGEGRTYVNETVTPPASAGKAPYSRITITDPVAGYRYDLNSSTMIAVQSRMPKAPPASTSTTIPSAPTLPSTTTRPNGATVTTVSLGTSTVNGVPATGTQTTEVIPAGAIGNAQAITVTRTSWISTVLKLPVQIKSSDPRVGTSDVELTNISTGEPSASLFTVPGGYTIQKGGGGRGPGGPGRPGGQGGSGGFGGAFRRGGPGPGQ